MEGNGTVREELAKLRTDFKTELEDTEVARDKIRGRIALVLIATLMGVVVATFAVITWLFTGLAELSSEAIIPLIQTVGTTLLTPLVGLIGAVTGFYYGSQTAVQAASQSAQATRAATRAGTEAATQGATQALSPAPPETNVTFGGETFARREFAGILAGEVIPDLRRRVDQTSEFTWEDVSKERDVEAEALVEATSVLFPPPYGMARPGVTYGILTGMVAMRAASSKLVAGEYSSPSDRYDAARVWVCENFSELIWWDCD